MEKYVKPIKLKFIEYKEKIIPKEKLTQCLYFENKHKNI